jgi:putative RecB family exonuclease
VRAEEPEVAELFTEAEVFADWLRGAESLLANYFQLEDPSRLSPESREQLVETIVDGLRLRGYVDRLDVSAAGDLRVVDYKTGSAPREAFEGKALFQLKFYALVLWRTRGVVPRQLKLLYLADADSLTASFDADELERFEKSLKALWSAIEKATISGDFRPNPGRLCDWCTHQELCPAKGGTPPPFPYDALAAASEDRRAKDGF